MTTNPKWTEIVDVLENYNISSENCPTIICRVFHLKFQSLMKDILDHKVFGEMIAYVYVVEFQKRDCHMPIFYFGCIPMMPQEMQTLMINLFQLNYQIQNATKICMI